MPERIVIHLGIHKTATTALQSFFNTKKDELQAGGVRYYSLREMRKDLTPLFVKNSSASCEVLRNRVNRCGSSTVFMSDENIIGAAVDVVRGELYAKSGDRIMRFSDAHKDKKIYIVIVLRDPSSLIPSLYCEYLRHNPFISFSKYISNFNLKTFRFYDVFSWATKMPSHVEVSFLPFESAYGGGVEVVGKNIINFLSGSGGDINFAIDLGSDRPRSSYSQQELEVAELISSKASGEVARRFLNMIDARNLRFGETKFSPIDACLAGEMSESYKCDLSKLCGAI